MGLDQFPKIEKLPDFYCINLYGEKPDITIQREDIILTVGAELEKDPNFKGASSDMKEHKAFLAIDDYFLCAEMITFLFEKCQQKTIILVLT